MKIGDRVRYRYGKQQGRILRAAKPGNPFGNWIVAWDTATMRRQLFSNTHNTPAFERNLALIDRPMPPWAALESLDWSGIWELAENRGWNGAAGPQVQLCGVAPSAVAAKSDAGLVAPEKEI